MSQRSQSQLLKQYQQYDDDMNEPGEMNLNDLIREGIMSEKSKNFELDMNFIQMDEMDFDLIKKDQQAPDDIEINTHMNKEVVMDEQRRQQQIEKQGQIETEKQSVIVCENNQMNPLYTACNNDYTVDDNLGLTNELRMDEENQSSFAQLSLQQNNAGSNNSSVIIEASSPKITLQKFQIIKLIAEHFDNNKFQDCLKIKEENTHSKIEFHLSDQKYQHPKLINYGEDADIKQNLLKTMKRIYQKKEAFAVSQSADNDNPLKIDMLQDGKVGDSHQYSRNLLKEFKNQSFQVRDRYFEKQSQIYKKYILNMKRTLRKQYERCRVHDDERCESNLDRNKLQERNKCQVEGNKKCLQLSNSQNNNCVLRDTYNQQHYINTDDQLIENDIKSNHRNVVDADRVIKYEAQALQRQSGEYDERSASLQLVEDQQRQHHMNNHQQQTINISQQQQAFNNHAQRNTHQQPVPQHINHKIPTDQQQLFQRSQNRMSLQQGQMGSSGIEIIGLIENDDDECTPMFGLEVEVVGSGNIGENNYNINNNDENNNQLYIEAMASTYVNVSTTGQSLTTISRTDSSNNNNDISHNLIDDHHSSMTIIQQGSAPNQRTEERAMQVANQATLPIVTQSGITSSKSIEQMTAEQLRQLIKKSMNPGVKRDTSMVVVEETPQNHHQQQQVQQHLPLSPRPQQPQTMINIELEESPSSQQQHELQLIANYTHITHTQSHNQQNTLIEEKHYTSMVQQQQVEQQQHQMKQQAVVVNDGKNVQSKISNSAIISNIDKTRNKNNDIIEIISQDSEQQSIQVPRKPSINSSNNTPTTTEQHHAQATQLLSNTSTTTTTRQTVSASYVRSSLRQLYPKIEQIIGAASDEQILTIYYELIGKQGETQEQMQCDDNGTSNLGEGNMQVERQYEGVIEQSQQQQQHQQQPLPQQQVQQQQQQQQQPHSHPHHLENPSQHQPISEQSAYQQQQFREDLTPEQLDLVIQNLIQSNSQIKEQISKLSREDLLALYKQGIRQMASRKAHDNNSAVINSNNSAINSNSNNNNNASTNNRPKPSSRRNKKAVAEIIDLEQDQQLQHTVNNNTSHQGSLNTNADDVVNVTTRNNNECQQLQQGQKQRQQMSQNYHTQQQQQACINYESGNERQQLPFSFSYLDQYIKGNNQNIKKASTTPITYKVNKTYLYALLQAHDYQNSLQTIFKCRQSINYQKQTEKEISILYLKHLRNHHQQKSTGFQIITSQNKSQQKDQYNKFFILTKKNLKTNKSSGFKDIDEKFRKNVHEGKYLTAERTVITDEKKKRILELRNKRITAEKMQLDALNKVQNNQSSWRNDNIYEQGEIPKLSTLPYISTLLSQPQQPQRRYYLFVEQERLDPREMNRLEQEIGLQQSKKRVKRTVMQRDEKQIARMIKKLAANIDLQMGIQLQ